MNIKEIRDIWSAWIKGEMTFIETHKRLVSAGCDHKTILTILSIDQKINRKANNHWQGS